MRSYLFFVKHWILLEFGCSFIAILALRTACCAQRMQMMAGGGSFSARLAPLAYLALFGGPFLLIYRNVNELALE